MTTYALNFVDMVINEEPRTYKEALDNKNCDRWPLAIKEKIEFLHKNEIKWLFKRKEGIHRIESPCYKAKLVEEGFTQREGVNFNEIFSLVVKHYSVRVLFAMVAQFDLHFEQMDVKTTFLHNQKVFNTRMNKIGSFLKRSLYGLKQSLCQWYKCFDNFILSLK
ncbi:hypothetical protein CR513_56057, partial [Mucuna pruriens]